MGESNRQYRAMSNARSILFVGVFGKVVFKNPLRVVEFPRRKRVPLLSGWNGYDIGGRLAIANLPFLRLVTCLCHLMRLLVKGVFR